jgi:hypothetical protein
MRNGGWLMRPVACCLVFLLLFPSVSAAALPGQDQTSSGQSGNVSPADASSQNSNGVAPKPNGQSSPADSVPNSPGSLRPQPAENSQSFSAQQSSSREQQLPEPVGTAAAGSIETTGVAASNPAGAAIAPAKQRRTRSILIKVGALVGAGAAVGAVAALSSGSPSRPPGAR